MELHRERLALTVSPTTLALAADPRSIDNFLSSRGRLFDPVARLTAQLFDVPVALVSAIDGHWQWCKSAIGLQFDQIPLAGSFAAATIQQPDRPLIVADAAFDRRFSTNLLVAGSECLRFYAGISVRNSLGNAIGTLAILDRRPRSMSQGDIERLLELARVVESLIVLHEGLQEASHAAIHDDLTGLANRSFFRRAIVATMQHAHSSSAPCALLYLDLDHFKLINDRWGHHVGDAVLREAARRLADSVRATDVTARLGGDEFAILIQGVSEAREVDSVPQRILQRFAVPFRVDGLSLSLSISIGIALSPQHAVDEAHLVRCADTALYTAKMAGRAGFCYYRQSQTRATLRQRGASFQQTLVDVRRGRARIEQSRALLAATSTTAPHSLILARC